MSRMLSILLVLSLAWSVDAFALSGGTRPGAPAPGVAIRTPAPRIGAGQGYACALRPDGGVQCWGENSFGQLGDGSTMRRTVPVAVAALSNVTAISVGTVHSCALVASGSVQCWGGNNTGQLGDGSTTRRSLPAAVSGLTEVIDIGAGGGHSCALLRDGTVRCWGFNAHGELGDGTTTDRHTPVQVLGLNNAVAVAVGWAHTCAVLADGTARCWGSNLHGQLGIGVASPQPNPSPQLVAGVIRAVAITAGGFDHTCALSVGGTVRCWGANAQGQVGDGSTADRAVPFDVVGLANVVAITAGTSSSYALLVDGSVRAWGSNSSGQLGDGTGGPRQRRLTPVQVLDLPPAVALAAYSGHACALVADGSARCWGGNTGGQLGNGTTTSSSTPLAVTGITGVPRAVAIAPGTGHTCAVRADGTVACWGSNNLGQLGNGTTTNSSNPVAAQGVSNAIGIATGDSHSCAIIATGTVRCWGNNVFGQIGDGTTTSRPTAVQVLGITNAVAITAGFVHACALLADGTARCWGHNGFGKLGDGSTTNRSTPVQVVGIVDAIAIAAGSDSTCALLSDGTGRCWGSGVLGQLGNSSSGSGNVSATPVFVKDLGAAVNLAAGEATNCATRTDGTAQCWGNNADGQIGDGTTVVRATPVAVTNLTGAVGLAGGRNHSCVIRSDGRARCWGRNAAGQLGNGTTNGSLTPAGVNDLSFAFAIAAGEGGSHTCALRATGVPSCWGLNSSGQLGDGTTTGRTAPVTVNSFAANIKPLAELRHHGHEIEVIAFVQCVEGQQVHVQVELLQDGTFGDGAKSYACTDRLEAYSIRVRMNGGAEFAEGIVQASLVAEIRDRGAVLEVLEWSRRIQVIAEDDEHRRTNDE